MKGTKRTSVIAIALALVLALSVLVGAGTDPTMNENGTQPVNNEGTADGVITFNVVCACHPGNPGNPVDATITGTAHYVLDHDSVVQPAEPTTTPSAEPTPTPTTAVEPSEDQVSTQADDQANDPADDSSDADDPSDENQDQEQPKPDPTKDEKFEGKVADIGIKTLTEENGAKYDLASVKITSVSAEGFKTNDELPKTVEAAEIENGTIPLTMTAIAPSISNVNWNVTKGKEGYGDLTYSANEMAYAVLIRDDKAVEDVNSGKFPTVLGTNEEEIKKALSAYDGELRKIKPETTIWFPEYDIIKSDDPSNPYPYTAKFARVTNAASERVIVTVNSHGIAKAQVVNKCFSYKLDPESGWSQYKSIEVTIDNIQALLDKGAKYIELVRTDNNGNEVVEKQQDLTNKTTTVTATATVDGDYTIKAYKYSRGTKSTVESLTFNVPQIDNDKPTVTIASTGDVINHIDVTASDTYSGVAGVYLSKVNFGYMQATNEDGTPKTNSITIYENQKKEDGTDNWVQIETKTLNVYKGTYVTSDGKKEVVCTNEFAANIGALPEYPTAADVTDEKIDTANSDAQKTAIEAAKAYFKDSENKDAIAGELTADRFDPAEKNTETVTLPIKGDGSYDAIAVWAVDAAGNNSDIAVIQATNADKGGKMVIDNTAPVVNSAEVKTLNDDSYSNSDEINIEATVEEDNKVETVTAYLVKKGEFLKAEALDDKKGTIKADLAADESGTYKGKISKIADGDYYVIVVAKDLAGNENYTVVDGSINLKDGNKKSAPFTIDTTAPCAAYCALELATADVVKGTADETYFNNALKLVLKFDEKHYASGEFVFLQNSKGENPNKITVPFTESKNGSEPNLEGENGSYTFTYKGLFASDGDYTPLYVKIKDKAGNEQVYKFNDEADVTGDTKYTFDQFTIDTLDPEVKVDYSNQTPTNDKYFNENRTAKITVTEHNFNGEKVNILTKDFKEGDKPASGAYIIVTETEKDGKVQDSNFTVVGNKWVTDKNDGDVHTLEIEYSGSVNYKFNVVVVDRSGRISADVKYDGNMNFAPKANDDFDVDKESPTITITGVTNGSAYNGEVGGTVEYKDANFQSATIRLMRADKNGVYDVTAQHTTALPNGAPGGTVNLVNFDRLLTNDGIYTLTATVVDMAGNTAESTVTFSVNRFGSTYKFDDYLASICDKHIKSVTDDLKITEINPDSITSGTVTITRNGKVIDSGDIAAVLQRSGSASGGWYEYLYTISKDLFKEDGMYKIVVSSKDAAGNEPNSENDEEFEIVFWVDDTPAEIAGIQGLEDAIINAENHTVKFTVRDNIGLKSVTVYCDSKEIAKFGEKDFTAGDLVDAQFTISEASSAQHIRIVAEDLSGNILDTDGTIEGSANTTVSFERDVTVSTNFFVRWFANKPLFFGSIAVIVAAGVGIYFIVAKKHKKEEATAE